MGKAGVTLAAALGLLLVSHTAAGPTSDPDAWTPGSDLVLRAETSARLAAAPEELRMMQSTAHYYWGTALGGKHVVMGVFVSPVTSGLLRKDAWTAPSVVPAMSASANVNCLALSVVYAVAADKIVALRCNGKVPPRPRA